MKIIIAGFVSIIIFLGCKKEKDNPVSPTLALIQHDWTVVSSRIFLPDGSSNYLLLNDKQDFRTDGKLIQMHKGVTGLPLYDTSIYQLLENNMNILFYGYKNGIQDNEADTATITTLTNDQFVYFFIDPSTRNINFVDSLKR